LLDTGLAKSVVDLRLVGRQSIEKEIEIRTFASGDECFRKAGNLVQGEMPNPWAPPYS
jgi:hypothetical protein